MSRRFIVGNWKMHKTISQAESLIKDILAIYRPTDLLELAVAPPFVALETAARLLTSSPISLAAQNVCATDEGAFTGEISPLMLREAGCRYVIIGHSERRQLFGETDQDINEKVQAALRHALLPILCVGERLEERQKNQTMTVIEHQLSAGLDGITKEHLEQMTIAYEPVWAIGTGHAATAEQAEEVHRNIRTFLSSRWNMNSAHTRIIYGGSVNADNAPTLFRSPHIDGALVGKACLNSETFVKIALAAT